MRILYMGTPEFAAQVLDVLLHSSHEVVGVVTRPDAIRARGKKKVSSPVKALAQTQGVPVLEYASLKSDESYEAIQSFEPDVICVAAYGAILPKRVLELPRFGCLNVHGSLLPRWRGAAPVERAILAGDTDTGIGIMRMEEGLDTGATAAVVTVPVDSKNAETLSAELASVGSHALVQVLDCLDTEKPLNWTEQPSEGVTYAEKIEKGELDIAPDLSAVEAFRRIQASSANHSSRCVIADKPLTVLGAALVLEGIKVPEGEVVFQAKRLYIGCHDGALEIQAVKPDGKKEMDAKAFAAGIQGIKQGGILWSSLNGEK